MANMSPKKNPIPEQDPNVRNKNFEEVALGYTVEMAVELPAPGLHVRLPGQCQDPAVHRPRP